MTARLCGGPFNGRTCDLEWGAVTIVVPVDTVLRYDTGEDGYVYPIYLQHRYRLAAADVYTYEGPMQ